MYDSIVFVTQSVMVYSDSLRGGKIELVVVTPNHLEHQCGKNTGCHYKNGT